MKTTRTGLLMALAVLISALRINAQSNPMTVNDFKNETVLKKCLDNHSDSILIYNEHDTTKIVMMNNLQGNLYSKLVRKFIAGNWVNHELSISEYTASGNLETLTEKIWKDGNWENSRQTCYTYDVNGNNLSFWKQDWVDSAWLKFELNNLTWDINGHLLSSTVKNYDNGTWINVYQTNYNYNTNGNLISKVHMNWEGNNWENAITDEYTYDQNDNILTMIEKFWINSAWENSTLFWNTWDNNDNRLTWLRQVWDGGNWVNSLNAAYSYDQSGNCLETVFQAYFNGNWNNYIKCTYLYEPGHINGKAYIWEGSWTPNAYYLEISRFVTGEQKLLFADHALNIDYYCNEITTGSEELSNTPTITWEVYPNPASEFIHVTTQGISGPFSISLYSVNGQKIKMLYQGDSDQAGENLTIPVSDLTPGFYILEMEGEICKSKQKLMVVK